MIPHVFIIGADKGGVGKTTVARLLLDYFRANGIDFKAFDTEHPAGGLKRFFPERVDVVDLTKSNDQMKVFDNIGATQATVIDIRAGLLTPTLKLLSDIGFFELAKANKLRIVVLHVLGPAAQSLEEIAPVVNSLAASRHVPVKNHINDTDYATPAGAITINKLDEEAAKAVDALAVPFNDFTNTASSFVLRGKTKKWMVDVFAQFEAAKLNQFSAI
ncbi:MAG: hypothetical protein U5N53_08995 [Mycobacterium sp.]|nr:hypothetical protein [Mycobacterium sp.]